MDLEHPMITYINKHGYPKEMQGLENVVNQPEHCGSDFYGTEILEGDEIVIDQEHFSEIVLQEHLKQYLIENLGFIFKGGFVFDANSRSVVNESELEEHLQNEYNFKFTIAD